MNILFICNQNKNRSKTAEHLFQKQFNTKSTGLYNDNPLSEKELSWADLVIVMEDHQRSEIAKRFPQFYLIKRILSWDIADIYRYNQPELVSLLKEKIREL